MPRPRVDIQAEGHDGCEVAHAASSTTERPEIIVDTKPLVLEPAGAS